MPSGPFCSGAQVAFQLPPAENLTLDPSILSITSDVCRRVPMVTALLDSGEETRL